MRVSIFGFIFFFFFCNPAWAYYDFDKNLQTAYHQIISLKFDDGIETIRSERKEKPGNDLCLLFENYVDFLKAYITEEDQYLELLKKNTEKRMDYLESSKADENSPFHLYVLSELYLQQALIRIKFREQVGAALDVRRASKLIEKNRKIFPTFILNKKISGFIQIMVGSVPPKYHWVTDIAGLKGSIPSGKSELLNLFRMVQNTEYDGFREEILFYLCIVHTASAGPEDETAQLMEMVQSFAVNSPMMRYCYSTLALLSGKNDKVIEVLTYNEQEEKAFPYYFLSYKRGLARLRKLDFSASKDFEYFLNHFKGMNYIKSGYQKLAWIFLMQGNLAKYKEMMSVCKLKGIELVDEDVEAQREAVSGELPNLPLTRARLLYDGAYYKSSLEQLIGKPQDSFPRYRDKIELLYRFGRIMEKTKQIEKAIEYYKETIEVGSSAHFYFAANSAFLLGTIFEKRNDFAQAKLYYQKSLSMRDHEYQNSIDHKAQAGLERVSK